MKLGELLILRGDIQTRLQQLRDRVVANAMIQEGDKPSEDPQALTRQAMDLHDQLRDLIVKINNANSSATLSDGRTLTEALADRDTMKLKNSMLRAIIEGARRKPDRYGMAEIKWVPAVPIAQLQKQADQIAAELRALNTSLQAANWEVEV